MMRINIILNFFKHKRNRGSELVEYNSNKSFILEDKISTNISEIDKKIAEISKGLVEAQIVKLRSTFSKSNNFIEQIGKNVYKTKLEESIIWYQKELKTLYLRRRELEITQEKLKGIFWLNQIKRLFRKILIGCLIFLILFIFLSGFMVIIYLMPLIILILFGYIVYTQKN
tara:strand:+ start:356 stop:868 length:513 start_codon:yes stop_codon:yes gene_type:complete